ncbi:MAG: dihydrodipicolinate synthase family protein [Betaproteobacteria bacterium]|nr:dihydrodipicolinate synthase family protein [Betaproteobacteria bacterium]
MPMFNAGLVHTPVTPFTRVHHVDFDLYGKLIEFHLRHGADSLALPMHAGESVSLGDSERQALLENAIRRVNGRVPVIAHVSQSGTEMAAALARHAEQAGAAAIVAAAPYYWTPPPAMLLEHFAQIGAAVRLPFFVYNAPEEMGGVKITTELALKLIERLDNFAGIVDSSRDWQFMIDVISTARRVRPEFQLLSGTEYMISAGAIGCTGVFSALSGIAPRVVRDLHDCCVEERYGDGRAAQEAIAALRQVVRKAGITGLKAAMRAMGRDCGEPRPPLPATGEVEFGALAERLDAIGALRAEPRGW